MIYVNINNKRWRWYTEKQYRPWFHLPYVFLTMLCSGLIPLILTRLNPSDDPPLNYRSRSFSEGSSANNLQSLWGYNQFLLSGSSGDLWSIKLSPWGRPSVIVSSPPQKQTQFLGQQQGSKCGLFGLFWHWNVKIKLFWHWNESIL